MLKKILNEKTCANCQICCSFVKADAWETPVFYEEELDYNKDWFKKYGKCSHTLKFDFKDDKEIKLCPYLNQKSGCTLSEEEKPFDCKIWPLRLMKTDDKVVIALSPICPGLPVSKIEEIRKLLDEGLRDKIMEKAKVPDLVKEYEKNWTIL